MSDDQSATALRYEVYRKQIDKLQTNNRGVYMLLDNKLKLLARCSPNAARQDAAKQHGALYAQFPSGLIRGALHQLQCSGVLDRVGEVEFVVVLELSLIHISEPTRPY